MSDNRYYRITSGFKNAWMESLSEDEIFKNLNGQKDKYISTYYYDKQHFENFSKTKSVAGIVDLKTKKIWFDLDSDDGGDEARTDTIELIHRLLKIFPIEAIDIYYSGNKGFHVFIKNNYELTRKEVETFARNLAKDLKTFDPSLYDFNQILRISNTQHPKTELFKIQVTPEELESLTITQIRDLAKTNRVATYTSETITIDKNLFKVEEKKLEKIKTILTDESDPLRIKELDFSSIPSGWKKYKWALSMGRFEIGKRNKAMMVIASTCRALKYGRAHTQAICEAADKLHCEITNDEPMNEGALDYEILNTVFGAMWNGGQYSKENDLDLNQYCEKYGFNEQEADDFTKAINLYDVNKSFKDFVKNLDKNTIKTGIKQLDEKLPITIGMNLGLVGAPAAGKTAIALEILKHTSMSGVVSVIASLDMHRNRLFEKVLYKVSQDVYKRVLSRKELYKKFEEDKDSELVEEVKRQYGNVYFYDRSSPSVADLRKFVLMVELQTGQKVKLLMIDYFERIGSDVTDATASSLKVANELQDLLNDLNVAIVTLVQPNKFSLAGGPDSPILNYTAIKGSSFLYQSFRAIISLWRPFALPTMPHLDKFLEMAILKNDLGELDHFKFNWDGKTGSIREMSGENEQQYEEYLKEKKQILTPQQEEPQFGQFRRNNPYGG